MLLQTAMEVKERVSGTLQAKEHPAQGTMSKEETSVLPPAKLEKANLQVTKVTMTNMYAAGDKLLESNKHPPKSRPMCLKNHSEAPCFDMTQCRPGTAKRPAITFAFDFAVPWTKSRHVSERISKAAKAVGAAVILMIPAQHALDATHANRSVLSHSLRKELEQFYDIVEVPWITPPNLSQGIPLYGGCCGAREFMKLHATGMDQYDAVINLDNDVDMVGPVGRLRHLFDCIASGMLLTTRGQASPVNGGFFGIRPQKDLLKEVLLDLESTHVSLGPGGWNGYGWGEIFDHKRDDFRIEGFFDYFFYLKGSKHVQAEQVDACHTVLPMFCPVIPCTEAIFNHYGECYNDEKLNFMHIPKTAGTSFVQDAPKVTRRAEQHYCHFQGLIVTMLRAPRSHVYSQFMHCKTSELHEYARSELEGVSFKSWLEKWIEEGEEADLFCCYNPHNLQKRFLTCKRHGDLKSARQRVGSMFMVGIAEFYQESQCLIHYQTTGQLPAWCNCMDKAAWDGGNFSHDDHGVAPHSIGELSNAELDLLDQLVGDDEKLYTDAVLRFKEDIKKVEEATKTTILCEDRALHQQSLSMQAWIALEDKELFEAEAGHVQLVQERPGPPEAGSPRAQKHCNAYSEK